MNKKDEFKKLKQRKAFQLDQLDEWSSNGVRIEKSINKAKNRCDDKRRIKRRDRVWLNVRLIKAFTQNR